MTTSQFLKIRKALVVASIAVDVQIVKATTAAQTRYYQRCRAEVDEGLRVIDSLEGERSDQPQQKALEVAS